MKSDISGFYKKPIEERIEILKNFASLTEEEIELLKKTGALDIETAERMIENVVSCFSLPLGIATNFLINGKDRLIPMVIEEPSVVAAASNAAKLCRDAGGFKTSSTEPIMIGQIQVSRLKDPELAKQKILEHKNELINLANSQDSVLISLGGGAKDIEARVIETKKGKMLIIHLLVNVLDAMGANVVNTMAESISPRIEELTGGKVLLRIISNLAVYRLAKAEAVWKKETLEKSLKGMEGEDIVERIIEAYVFADADPYRCATHNKGVMNGIDAVTIATGNDFRAIEAGAHSYASLKGYKPLTWYEKNENGDLVGRIEIPVAVGIVGGSTRTNPLAKLCIKILGVKTARELGEVLAAVGLAQNFAALRALATEGIQKGHMKLHAKNIAVTAGAKGELIDKVAEQMVKEGNIRVNRAKEILEEIKKQN